MAWKPEHAHVWMPCPHRWHYWETENFRIWGLFGENPSLGVYFCKLYLVSVPMQSFSGFCLPWDKQLPLPNTSITMKFHISGWSQKFLTENSELKYVSFFLLNWFFFQLFVIRIPTQYNTHWSQCSPGGIQPNEWICIGMGMHYIISHDTEYSNVAIQRLRKLRT